MKRLAGSVMLLAAFSVGGCMTAPATHVAAPAWVSTSTASKQEIWGVYDGLAGTTWSAPNAYVLFYRWAVPGQVLVEEFRHPTTGELSGTNTIVPGPAPGTLTLTSSVANMQWTGTLDGKGNALFARDGLMRMPMRTGRTASGDLFQEKVTLDGVRVASVDSSTIYSPLGKAAVDNSAVAAPATPASVVATTSPSAATSASSVSETPGSGWGVFDKSLGRTWLSEGSGGRGAHAFLLRLEKSADGNLVTAYTGNSHRFAKSIEYRRAASGAISASGNTVIGTKQDMRVTLGADGELVRFNSDSDRSTYHLDAAGYLVVKHETRGWASDSWTPDSTVRLRDVSMGPEWGPFAKLAGSTWINKEHVYPTVYYEFSYPEKNLIQVWIGPDNQQHWGDDVVLLKDQTVIGHTESRIKNSYLLEPGSSTYSVDSATSMTRHIGANRKDVYTIVNDNLVSISQQELKDGTWQSIKEVRLSREQENEKDARLEMWAAHAKAQRDSESSTRFLNDMAALNGVLTSANAIASQRTAESQASLERTLDNLARQAAQERASVQDPQPGPSTQSTPDTLAGQSTEAEQDAVVARAMAQARQVAREAGDEGAVDRAISDTNRFIDQQAQASKPQVQSDQPVEASKPPVQSTQPAKASSQASSTEAVNFSYLGCVVDEFPVRTTYISNIARIVHLGDQQRWNEEFFRRHVAEAYDRDLSKLHAYCALDRNEQAGLERRLNGTRKQHARQGIPIIEVDWSPEKRF